MMKTEKRKLYFLAQELSELIRREVLKSNVEVNFHFMDLFYLCLRI